MTVETTVVTGIDDVLAFIEKAAPAVQGELAALAKTALTDAKSAFTPVADAAVIAAVALITSKFALNAPFSATEIAFLQGVIAKLSTLIPTPAA